MASITVNPSEASCTCWLIDFRLVLSAVHINPHSSVGHLYPSHLVMIHNQDIQIPSGKHTKSY